MDFYIHSTISQKIIHLAKILWERSLFSIKFSFEWVYFRAAKPRTCSSIYIKNDTSGFLAYNNSIVESIRSISQKSKFYRRAVSKFLYTMCKQCGMFYSLYWEYELKVLHVSVKLAYLGIYFTKKHARRRFIWLTVLLRLQHFSCFSNIRAECYKIYWLYWKMLQIKVAQN